MASTVRWLETITAAMALLLIPLAQMLQQPFASRG